MGVFYDFLPAPIAGSRYFTIQNSGSYKADSLSAAAGKIQRTPGFKIENVKDIPVDHDMPVRFVKGLARDGEPREKYPGSGGVTAIEIKELERIELDFSTDAPSTVRITGYQLEGKRLRPLPTGSTLDRDNGKFYWLPGPGFTGEYRLVFIEHGPGMEMKRRNVNVTILPKFKQN